MKTKCEWKADFHLQRACAVMLKKSDFFKTNAYGRCFYRDGNPSESGGIAFYVAKPPRPCLAPLYRVLGRYCCFGACVVIQGQFLLTLAVEQAGDACSHSARGVPMSTPMALEGPVSGNDASQNATSLCSQWLGATLTSRVLCFQAADPAQWELQGSADGLSWATISAGNVTFACRSCRTELSFLNNASYSLYRLGLCASQTATTADFIALSQVELIGSAGHPGARVLARAGAWDGAMTGSRLPRAEVRIAHVQRAFPTYAHPQTRLAFADRPHNHMPPSTAAKPDNSHIL